MNILIAITFILSLAAAAYFWQTLGKPLSWIFSATFVLFGCVALARIFHTLIGKEDFFGVK
jgi:phosphatidylserine synthase